MTAFRVVGSALKLWLQDVDAVSLVQDCCQKILEGLTHEGYGLMRFCVVIASTIAMY